MDLVKSVWPYGEASLPDTLHTITNLSYSGCFLKRKEFDVF